MRKHVGTAFMLTMLLLMSTMTVMAAAKVRITHITYPHHGKAWTDYLYERAKVFNAHNTDIEVDVQIGDSDYASKFTVMLAAGVPPDVTDFHPALGATHIVNGVFADLRPFLSRSGLNLSQLTSPAVVQALTGRGGAIWGLPADIAPAVTYYKEIERKPTPLEVG